MIVHIVGQRPVNATVEINVLQSPFSPVDQMPRVGRIPARRIGEEIGRYILKAAGRDIYGTYPPKMYGAGIV